MCGIVGVLNWKTGKPVDKAELSKMTDAIVHRGPDWQAVWTDKEFGFGMTRLSIIGGDEANQPLWTDDKIKAIVFNGEIYNYREINTAYGFDTTSDTLTLLKLYEKIGSRAFSKLVGMFSCAIFDRSRRTLTLARDHFGQKPLFITDTKDGIAFASAITPLLNLDGRSCELEMESVSEFLSLGYTAPDRTPVRGITPFPAATWKTYGKYAEGEEFWGMSNSENDPDAEDEFYDRFRVAVKRRLVSDVPIGIFLSGGMDSNAVLAMMLKEKPGCVAKAFTIAPVDGISEVKIARKTCSHFGISLEEVELSPDYIVNEIDNIVSVTDKLLANPPMFAMDALSQCAEGQLKVILGGGGGDELFYGYPTWKADWVFQFWRILPLKLRKAFSPIQASLPVDYSPHAVSYALEKFIHCPTGDRKEAHGWWRTLITGNELEALNPDFQNAWGNAYKRAYEIAKTRFEDFERQTTMADLLVWWQGMGLYLSDAIPMGRGVELRSPFMDHELAEWTTRMSLKRLYSPLKSKPFLREKLRPILPEWVVNAQKKPFYIPFGQWMAGPISGFMRDSLYDCQFMKDGFITKNGTQSLLESHINGRKDNSFKLLALLTIVRWYELVFLNKREIV